MTDNYVKTKYKVKKFEEGHFADEIKKKVAEAKKDNINKNIEKNYANNIDIEFWRIQLPKDLLFYYLGNNRTGSLCQDFIKRKNAEGNDLPEDYFDIKNTSRVDVQQDYHEIIFNEANHEVIAEQYRLQGEQLDEIYITAEGVVVNGNSRLSTIREKLHWAEVECYVYPEKFSNKWDIIESHTSQRDNKVNFAQEDPWYSKAHTHFKYESQGKSPIEIATLMNYTKGSDAKRIQEMEADVKMCHLAEAFLASDEHDEYEYLIDLKKLGGESGKQVFSTMSTRLSALSKKGTISEHIRALRDACFDAISLGEQGGAKNLHTAISDILHADNVSAFVRERIKDSNDKTQKPEIEVDTSKDARKARTKKIIDDAALNKKIKNELTRRQMFKDGVVIAERELRDGLKSYDSKSVIVGIDDYIKKIEAFLEEYKEKIDNHKS